MTTMNSNERLKQIRERSESKKRVAAQFEWARVGVQEWADIDFLLSLLDGQSDAATRMREACVEKVREVARKLGEGDNQIAAQQVNGCLRAIDAMQSLTPEQKQQ